MNPKLNAVRLALLAGLSLGGVNLAHADDCTALQDQKNLIYAAHGYCFKNADAQKQYGADCHTKRPSFTDNETKRISLLDQQLKAQRCPKVN